MNSTTNESNPSVSRNLEKVYVEIKDVSGDSSGSENDILIDESKLTRQKSFLFRKSQGLTICHYILFYGYIQGYMEQLFPANYSLFESLLSMNPVTIGTAAFLQKLMFTITSPFWGMVIDHSDQVHIMKFSIISLTISSLLICFSQTTNQFFFAMCFWGSFSAVLGPLSQKIASERILDSKRGKYFGRLMFFQTIGKQCALLLTGMISNKNKVVLSKHFGIWMFPFLISSLFGIILYFLLRTFLSGSTDSKESRLNISLKSIGISSIQNLGYAFKSKIVISLFILGMVNAIPRSALNFIPMWLQTTGLSQFSASFIVSISWVAAMFVSPIVGFVSDLFYNISPSKGRIMMAQLSLVFRSIFIYYLIARIPTIASHFESETSKIIIFSIISFIIGLFAGWPGIGACRPLLCEVILPQHRATVFALSSTFEGIGAAFFGTRFVGDLAVFIFGYDSNNKLSNSASNYVALGNAILCMTILPWMISILLFYFITKESQKNINKEKSSMDRIPDTQSFIEIKTI
ncbi:membrane associated transporter [Cryptosporidium canis]|uniref:Membrane associated transporter n=1 Tax=Cryptosporidium canis TaxID=195482 RepID=A0ABQ8PAX7_9CRYT|nr:membrane associated transporter [Cryptosporidium canis]KAJ1614161.1 membrane associated transporter [Cryptosporidium canis]